MSISCSTLADIMGFDAYGLRDLYLDRAHKPHFDYDVQRKHAKEATIVRVLKRIDSDTQRIGGNDRYKVWESGWEENYVALSNSKDRESSLAALVPAYIRPGQIMRLNGEYVKPKSKWLELELYSILRSLVGESYLSDAPHVYEFGAGTGYNLALWAKENPAIQYTGFDFSRNSVKLINLAAQKLCLPFTAEYFNMVEPEMGPIAIEPGSAIVTCGSIEQLGENSHKFVDWMTRMPFKRGVHLEPVMELYDSSSLFDYLALMFLKKRGYTDSLLTDLERIENEGRIRIVKKHHTKFGSMMMDGYCIVVWETV